MALIIGTPGDDTRTGTAEDDVINGLGGHDTLSGLGGNDTIDGGDGDDLLTGGRGNDTITGGGGFDRARFNVDTGGSDTVNLGPDFDAVYVSANSAKQVRLTFTSSEVGNGAATDAGTGANQDGGLAVRLQREDGSDGLTGPVSRFDDEGMTFVAAEGVSFDVRDLVSGAARGDQFEVVVLGRSTGELIGASMLSRSHYFNAGQGDDTVLGGNVSDFLVGGAGNDILRGFSGDDRFIGGGGNDTIEGGAGDDTIVSLNASTDGADRINLGDGQDRVNVSATGATQIRLTFTSAEVGNGTSNDSGTMANQDGGLAVRLQAENGADVPTGMTSRVDDEGIVFEATTAGLTFDVRDLVSGAARGDQFRYVFLGTQGGDTTFASLENDYVNGGQGNDDLRGLSADDFLVGGAGDDRLDGGFGSDSFIGGGGNDTIDGDSGDDRVIFNVSADGTDSVNLGAGTDVVNVSTAAPGQVRLTFTSAEVGNDSANDSGSMTNQDGGLAVRLQAEDGAGGLTGPVSRFDDEGITFVAAAGATFDVRDLVSGAARGDRFEVVRLGTEDSDTLESLQASRPYYINGGAGNDSIFGGEANDFLVGGSGDDDLDGDQGADSFIGGSGNDVMSGGAGNDVLSGGAGHDFYLGNAGVDTATFATATASVKVDLGRAGPQDTGEGVDVFSGIENLTGSNQVDFLSGGSGANVLNGGGGGDVLMGRGGPDRLDGGAGIDTASFREASTAVGINRQTATHTGEAQGDFHVSIERFLLTDFDDRFQGFGENESIYGYAGDDTIDGGRGSDLILGGVGQDLMTGGAGGDLFVFTSLNESTNAANDRITDFRQNGENDRIDLSAIDANSNVGGNQAFVFVDDFSGAGGEARLSYDPMTNATSLTLDVDGDQQADFTLLLDGQVNSPMGFIA